MMETTLVFGPSVEIPGAFGDDDNDVLTASGRFATGKPSRVPVFVNGGLGNDMLRGGSGPDTLDGGKGDDEEHGGEGSDAFFQGNVENGSDLIFGGTDTDGVDYGKRRRSVIVRLDERARDGKSGENDSIGHKKDVEAIVGGREVDRLIGNKEDNVFRGGRGPDFLKNGKAGTDTCAGGPGNDTLQNCE
jgi:Ca2+-binding RTX toxin-like protein